jgi:large conductance mechanosensitive channel
VIDLAVGIIIGAAFGKIVSSLVSDILMPPIGYALGNVDFKDLAWTLRPASAQVGADGKPLEPAILLGYGKFIQALIDFVIIALCVFFLVKLVNRMHGPKEEAPKAPSDDVKLLTEIRDLLKSGASASTPPAN